MDWDWVGYVPYRKHVKERVKELYGMIIFKYNLKHSSR